MKTGRTIKVRMTDGTEIAVSDAYGWTKYPEVFEIRITPESSHWIPWAVIKMITIINKKVTNENK